MNSGTGLKQELTNSLSKKKESNYDTIKNDESGTAFDFAESNRQRSMSVLQNRNKNLRDDSPPK